jgi:hypothetical protein
MKYLRKYDFFKEVLNISTTDRPDEKLAKQSANEIEADLKEYKEKKPKIDQLYNATKNNLEIEQKLKTILPEKENKNQFLVDYLRICRIQNEILTANNDKILAQANKSTASDDKTLKEITDKISNFDKILAEKSKEMKDLMASHKNKMIEVEKELKKDTQEIQSKK